MKGVRVVVKGRLGGRERKSKRVSQYGKLGLQEKLSRIDYWGGIIYTIYGTIGVKVQSAHERKAHKMEKRIKEISHVRAN